MPRLSDLLETRRAPVTQAGIDLAFAEASLNGWIARHRLGHAVAREALIAVVDAVYEARDRLDALRFAAAGIERLPSGREPTPNDRDDMLDAVLGMLDPSISEGFVEAGLIQRARRRGAAILEQSEAA